MRNTKLACPALCAVVKWVMLILLMGIMVTGYGGLCKKKDSSGSSGDAYTISDGTIAGIGSYTGLISANINCNPNSGPYGTPVTITITFSSGGSYINAIKVYQKLPYGSYNYTPAVDPYKQSANVWVTPSDIILYGNAGWIKFIGVDGSATEICLGVIEVNNPSE